MSAWRILIDTYFPVAKPLTFRYRRIRGSPLPLPRLLKTIVGPPESGGPIREMALASRSTVRRNANKARTWILR